MSRGVEALDASMDPWCTVEFEVGRGLFGFATRHHRTGGLAWTRSSLLIEVAAEERWARTFSGTLFQLGTRFHVSGVGGFGTEAQLAFRLLMDDDAVPGCATPLLSDRASGEGWLTACKMARHLDLPTPPPNLGDTMAFLRDHGPAYRRLRSHSWLVT